MIARLFACLTLPMIAFAPAIAQSVPAVPKAKLVKEKKICRGDRNSSSRIAPKICKTQSQWDATVQSDADQADEAMRRGLSQSRGM